MNGHVLRGSQRVRATSPAEFCLGADAGTGRRDTARAVSGGERCRADKPGPIGAGWQWLPSAALARAWLALSQDSIRAHASPRRGPYLHYTRAHARAHARAHRSRSSPRLLVAVSSRGRVPRSGFGVFPPPCRNPQSASRQVRARREAKTKSPTPVPRSRCRSRSSFSSRLPSRPILQHLPQRLPQDRLPRAPRTAHRTPRSELRPATCCRPTHLHANT